MEEVQRCARLLATASEAYRDAVGAISSDGHLEREVEDAAAACWGSVEKSVQVKGRLFRQKTLHIEDPVFNNDAEQAFGEALGRWSDKGAAGVAAAAVEVKVAELSLAAAASQVLESSPTAMLQALDSLLSLYEQLVVSCARLLPTTIELVQQATLQVGDAFRSQHSALEGSSENSVSMASLASILARHGTYSTWAVSLVQPGGTTIAVPLLEALVDGSSMAAVDAKTVLQLLAQSDLESISEEESPRAVEALCSLLPLMSQGGGGGAQGGAQACTTIHILVQKLAGRSTSAGEAAVEGLLQALLAASKGVSVPDLRAALHMKSQGGNGFSVGAVDIQSLANWIFSASSNVSVQADAIGALLQNISFSWLKTSCPPSLRLRWLLATVAAAKVVAKFGDSTSSSVSVVQGLADELASRAAWVLCQGAVEHDAEETHVLCMLEVPASEPQGVHLLWSQLKGTLALSLCSNWLLNNESQSAAAQNISNLVEGSCFVQDMRSIAGNGRAAAVASICGYFIDAAASSMAFPCMLPSLSAILEEALAIQETHRQLVGILAGAAARAVKRCMSSSSESLLDVSSNTEAIGNLVEGVQLLDISSPDATTDASVDTAADAAAPPTSSAHLEKKDQEDVHYAAVCGCLSLLSKIYSLLGDSAPPSEALLSLLSKMTLVTYAVLGENNTGAGSDNNTGNTEATDGPPLPRRFITLATILSASTDGLAPWTQQAIAKLLSAQRLWLAVLASWLGDANALHALLPEQQVPGQQIHSTSEVEIALKQLSTASSPASADARGAEEAGIEALLLQEALNGEVVDISATVVLWYELFFRVARHKDALQPLLDRAALTVQLGNTAQKTYPRDPMLANTLSSLASLMNTGGETAHNVSLLPFIGTVSAATAAAKLDISWRTWAEDAGAQGAALATMGPSSALPVLEGPLLDGFPPRIPPPDLSVCQSLVEKQHMIAQGIEASEASIRRWARKGGKAAAIPEGEERLPTEGREGDVPHSLAEAQRLLWEGSQRWADELAELNAALRQRVCQQYVPVDVDYLQATAEMYEDGARIPRQHKDASHARTCAELRTRARAVADQALTSKEVATAAVELHKTEHLILSYNDAGETSDELYRVKPKLLAIVAECLVDGSSPPVAAPYLAGLFERGVMVVELDSPTKLRLVPRIAQALVGTEGAPPLGEREGVRLLKASLDPDALLDAGKLREFLTTLVLVQRWSCDVADQHATSLLRSFDAQRFAVLAVEKAGGSGGGGGGGSGSSSSASSAVGVDEVLGLAAKCLSQPGAAATGSAILEGIVGLAPAAYFAACLGVVLAAPDSGARDALLSMLAGVPIVMLPEPVIAESLDLLTEALRNGSLGPPSLPYDLFAMLYRSEAAVQSLKVAVEHPDQAGRVVKSSVREKAWTIIHSTSSNKAAPGGPGASSSSGGGGSGGGGSKNAALDTSAAAVAAAEAHGQVIPACLQPVASSHRPLSELCGEAISAVLESMMRALNFGFLDSSSFSDQLQQFLGVLFEIVGQQGGWALEWTWTFLYQERLHGFLATAGAATGGATTTAFKQYWGSLPWSQAIFHASSPRAIASIRAFLPSVDRAAAELMHSLDWGEVLAKALPPTPLPSSAPPAPAESVQQNVGIHTLLNDGEDEEELEAMLAAQAVVAPSSSLAAPDQPAWAAEVGLLLLHASIFLPLTSLPAWMSDLIGDQQYTGDSGAVALLASADWERIRASIKSAESAVPWLALPLLMAPQAVEGDAGERVVRAALLLCRAAIVSGTLVAAEVASSAIHPLFGLSVCQGLRIEQRSQGGARPSPSTATTAALASHELLTIPSDIPPELLEGTVELEQMRLQQEELRLAQEEAAAVAAAAAESVSEAQGPGLQVIELTSCFRMTAYQHATLLQTGLGPLARLHATADAIRSFQREHCTAFFETPTVAAGGGGGDTREDSRGLLIWDAPSVTSLIPSEDALLSAKGRDSSSTSRAKQARSASEDLSARAAVLGSLLRPLTARPVTILTQDLLPFGNADLPWDTDAALFISRTGGEAPPRPQRGSMRALRQQLKSLLRGGSQANSAAQNPAGELNRVVINAPALRNLLITLVEDACMGGEQGSVLAGALLRQVFVCASLRESPVVTALAENLLRRLASPPSVAGLASTTSTSQSQQPALSPAGPAVVPIVTVSAGSIGSATVAQMEDVLPQAGRLHHNTAADRGISVPRSMQHAVAAATGIPATGLLSRARTCAALRRPLLCAFALERARVAAAGIDNKAEWQTLVTQAIEAAISADANGDHPLEIVGVWLEVLNWLEGKRWKTLPPGPHRAALIQFLAALDQRVEVVQVLTPEELLDPRDSSIETVQNPLTAAAGRIRSGAHALLAPRPDAAITSTGATTATGSGIPVATDDDQHPSSSRFKKQLSSGLKSFSRALGRDGSPEGNRIPMPAEHAQHGTQLPMSNVLSPPGPIIEGGLQEVPLTSEIEPAGEVPGPSQKFTSGFKNFGKQLASAGNKLVKRAGGGTEHYEEHPSSNSNLYPGEANALVQPPAAPLPPPAPLPQAPLPHRSTDRRQADPIDAERDILVRLGLAAHSVAAYIRSVMDVKLSRRTLSVDPGSPSSRSQFAGGITHIRGNSSLTGSRHLEEQQLRELDTVMEARSELDALAELQASPLMAARPEAYSAFMSRVPELLQVATSVGEMQATVAKHLLPGTGAAQVLAVLSP